MNGVALDPAYRRISVEEFLGMDFGDAKAELDDGLIYMMTGGTEAHAWIAGNILAFLRSKLRGSGCRAYGSDFGLQTRDRSVRFPDVSVHCRPLAPDDVSKQLLGDPQVIIEILSPSTAAHDQRTKLVEYRALSGVQEILFVDPARERVRLVARTGPESWNDAWLPGGADVELTSIGITIPHGEIFARD